MNKDLVSIIVLSYRNLEYIKETIDSILTQSYDNIELIVADDGTEKFNNKKYEDYINKKNVGNIKNTIIYTNEKNLGTVKNVNKAIKLSSGKYIKLIAADDIFYSKGIIVEMINYMNKNNSLILTTNVLLCDSNMNKSYSANKQIYFSRKKLPIGMNPSLFFKELSKLCCISAPGVMIKKDIFNMYGMFDENYMLIEDWNMWLRLSREGVKFDYLDIISVRYRGGVGISTSNEPNPIYVQDHMKCIEKEILPYKNKLGYWLYKNIAYKYVRLYKFNEYSVIKKILFIISNIDIISFNQFGKILVKLKRNKIQ